MDFSLHGYKEKAMIHVSLHYLQQECVQAHQQTGRENTIAEWTNKTKTKKTSTSIICFHYGVTRQKFQKLLDNL